MSFEESSFEEMIPHPKEESSYLMFCSPATDVTDEEIRKLELDKFMDCIPQTPIGIMLERVSETLFVTFELISTKVPNTKIHSLINNRTDFLDLVNNTPPNQKNNLFEKVQFDESAFTKDKLTENVAYLIVESMFQRSMYSNNFEEIFQSAGIVS